MKITSSPIIYKTVHYEVLKFNINNSSDLAIIASTYLILQYVPHLKTLKLNKRRGHLLEERQFPMFC